MQNTGADLTAESLLGIAKYIIELLNPSHELATRNLEEIISDLKHDFKNKLTRLKCVAMPKKIISNLTENLWPDSSVIDKEACAVVGLKAGIALGIPVGGTILGLISKCLCPVVSLKECGPRCQSLRQVSKVYALHLASNRKVPPYQLLVDESWYHNIKTYLYGSVTLIDQSVGIKVSRCDRNLGGRRIALKFSNKAVVSWIEQPLSLDNSSLSACLSSFFEVPRHLHKGDIFKVDVSEHAPQVLFLPGNFALKELYFIVKSIEGPPQGSFRNASESIGFLVFKGETALVQDSNAHSFLPSSSLSSYSKLGALVPKFPQGLKKVYDRLLSAIIPFLKGSASGLTSAFLLIGPAGCGKQSLVSSAAAELGMNIWIVDCAEIRSMTPGLSVGKLKAVLTKAKQYAPCILQMSSIHLLSQDQDGHQDSRVLDEFREQLSNLRMSKLPVILVGTTDSSNNLSPAFARTFLLEFAITALEKEERKLQLIQFMAKYGACASDECMEDIATRCSGFLLGDLLELVTLAVRNSLCGKQQLNLLEENVNNDHIFLTLKNYVDALDKMQSAYAGSIGAPKIPSVKWNDVGGLEEVKKEIVQTVTMPLKHPGLTAGGLGRSGLLLYGPPGTGKTLLAKAVATECNLYFLSVKGPELLNMYVGQSEANVREIFERARESSPCIIFFDELDALAPNRGRSGDSGGVMDRVVSQLLSELDGLNKSHLLFVIGATNRPDLIDPALLRPGRFDKLLYVGAYEDHQSKFSVMSALTRKFKLSSDVDLKLVSEKLPLQVTGADMYAVCSGAWLGAVRRVITQNKQGSKEYPKEVEVTQEDFNLAVSKMVPSVSAEDMLYFKGLQQQMSAIPVK